jgi:CheY-like chemotaxis protein/anti-sigma regulatory factor (Ser/Thr protein kinase)
LTLTVSLPPEACYVDGDTVRLAQVFSNLLNNACRYTPVGGTVEVGVKHDDANIEVSVRDSGIGVAPEMQERIFDLFEQANKSLERGTAGLGVGLTLARQLVQLHGGTVTMTSPGLRMGSCFTVRVPLLKVTDAPSATERRSDQSPATLKILVADDNVDLADSLAVLLQTQGHHVVIALDGEAALRAARDDVPDVALLDIGMPGRNGYEVARLLRSQSTTQGIYLVAITGWGQPADKAEADAAGFDLHLVKPVAPDELFKVLTRASGSPAAIGTA